jgi:hypothetical protein
VTTHVQNQMTGRARLMESLSAVIVLSWCILVIYWLVYTCRSLD